MNERDSSLIQSHLVINLVRENMRKTELGSHCQISSKDNTILPTPLNNTPILHILLITADIPLYLQGDMATIHPCIMVAPHLLRAHLLMGGTPLNISALAMVPRHHILVEEPSEVTQRETRVDLEGDMITTHTGVLAMRTSIDQRENGAVRREKERDNWKRDQGF